MLRRQRLNCILCILQGFLQLSGVFPLVPLGLWKSLVLYIQTPIVGRWSVFQIQIMWLK
jgi:hypothetical protein